MNPWMRLSFVVIAGFWVTMNFFLWRSETTGANKVGSAVSFDMVLEKILTSPDTSSLEIYHRGKRIGFCTLSATVGVQGSKNFTEDFEPEGMVKNPTNYKLDLEGNLNMEDSTNRLHFEADLKLSPSHDWQEFNLRAGLRPNSWEIHTQAKDQNVRVVMNELGERWEQTFTFDELRNPRTLLQEMSGAMTLTLLGALGNLGLPPGNGTNVTHSASAVKWEANNDSMRFGHSRVRVYRLHGRLLQRLDVYIFVSRVGEILWIELPDKIVFSNEAFTHF